MSFLSRLPGSDKAKQLLGKPQPWLPFLCLYVLSVAKDMLLSFHAGVNACFVHVPFVAQIKLDCARGRRRDSGKTAVLTHWYRGDKMKKSLLKGAYMQAKIVFIPTMGGSILLPILTQSCRCISSDHL